MTRHAPLAARGGPEAFATQKARTRDEQRAGRCDTRLVSCELSGTWRRRDGRKMDGMDGFGGGAMDSVDGGGAPGGVASGDGPRR